jgi:squalene-hopene/tetraprenyl-beta-curcumene cyclase
MPVGVVVRIDAARRRAIRFLIENQRADGSWLPLWFGNQSMADDENPTYGTAKVLAALCGETDVDAVAKRGVNWLLRAQNGDGGWGGGAGSPSTIEETALAVDALAHVRWADDPVAGAIQRGVAWLVERTRGGTEFAFSPIGFYFAKLWYYERDYPAIFTVSALGRVAALVASRDSA